MQCPDTGMLFAYEFRCLQRNLKVATSWVSLELEAEPTGGPVQFVIAHAELLGQVRQHYPVTKSVAQRPHLGEPSPPASYPTPVLDDHAHQRAVSHPPPCRRSCDL